MKEFLKKVWKKIDHFWEYYKWFAIVPAAVIGITVSFVYTYRVENQPIALGIGLVNTSEVGDAILAFQVDYVEDRNLELPVKVEYDFTHPEGMMAGTLQTNDMVASLHRYQGCATSGKVDVSFVTDWVVDEYMEIPLYADLRDLFDEKFLAEHEDKIYYVIQEEIEARIEIRKKASDGEVVDMEAHESIDWEAIGEKIPVGFYVGECEFLGEFSQGEEPIMVYSKVTQREEECVAFTKWIFDGIKNEDAD